MYKRQGIDRENVHHVLDVDTGRAAVGERVVVCGGGRSGTESALQLAMDGKKVTVVDMPVSYTHLDVYKRQIIQMVISTLPEPTHTW